jgi:predicted DNA-binding transcriptional regulator YafY
VARLNQRIAPEFVSERLDRLLGLMASRQKWNGPALASELGISLRTLRRDMARLSARGVPVESRRGRTGGVWVPANTGLGRLQLDQSEVLDLLLALAIAERLRSPLLLSSIRDLRQKIAMSFPPEERLKINRLRRRVLQGPPASSRISDTLGTPRSNVLWPVQQGFFELRAIEIEYKTAKELTARTVEPHYFMLRWPVWYLLVWDHLREAVRILRLDRIESARLTEEKFKLRDADEMLTVARDLFAPI